MRSRKCFMEIEVTNVGTNEAGSCEAYLCIHIGTVHIYLSTVLVDYCCYFFY